MRIGALLGSAWRGVKANPLLAGLLLLGAFAVVQMVLGAIDAGVTTDEPVHTNRLSAFLEDGWYVPGGDPDKGLSPLNPFVYGPVFSLLGHVANVAARNEALDTVSHGAGAYAVRHVTVALVSMLALAAAGLGTWRLTRSPRFGLFAALALIWGLREQRDIDLAAGADALAGLLSIAAVSERRAEPLPDARGIHHLRPPAPAPLRPADCRHPLRLGGGNFLPPTAKASTT